MKSEPDRETRRIVDKSGNPLPQRTSPKERIRTLSSKTKIAVTAVLAVVVSTASFLASYGTIVDYFRPEPSSPSVPVITVKLSNGTQERIDVVARSDFFLWLPGGDARHYVGKYEFNNSEGVVPDIGTITVEPDTTITVYAKILNESLYGRFLEKAEYDITLHVRRVDGSLTFTENLPFTRQAIDKYFVTATVGYD